MPVTMMTKVFGRHPAIAIVDHNRVGQRQDFALRQIIDAVDAAENDRSSEPAVEPAALVTVPGVTGGISAV